MRNFDNLTFRNLNKIDFSQIKENYEIEKIDFESYKKQKISDLNRHVKNKVKIYLDLKYLIKMRDSLREDNSSIYKIIFFKIKELVKANKVICPFSDSISDEILKQSNPESRVNTAELFDILSNNIAIKPIYYILIAEFYNVLRFYNGREMEVINYWDFPISTIGDINFEITNGNNLDTNLIKILFWEGIVSVTIQEIIAMQKDLNCSNVSSILESIFNSTPFATDEKSFEKIVRDELSSCFISIGELLDSSPTQIQDVLLKFDNNKITEIAPSVFIFSSLHGEMMRDKFKKYNRNDYYDIFHCCLAIPNCDYFFTEAGFMHRTKNVLKLDKLYNIQIESDPQIIIELLDKI